MYGENITLIETLEITIISMLIVFSILILISFIVSLFRFIPDSERISKKYKKNKKRDYISFEKMDDDMKTAVLVATIDYRNEVKTDVRLKSIKKL
ncbi:OadG family protein [Mycoplasmatota bacterium WC44]